MSFFLYKELECHKTLLARCLLGMKQQFHYSALELEPRAPPIFKHANHKTELKRTAEDLALTAGKFLS